MDRDLHTRFGRDATGLPALRQQADQDFDVRANDLSAFLRERGRAPEASAAHDPAEARLGSWLDGQRAADRRGRLGAQRAAVLQSLLGIDWSRAQSLGRPQALRASAHLGLDGH